MEGLRQYKRTDATQELQVCNILASKPSESRALKPSLLPTMPAVNQKPGFNGCSFTNCVFQIGAPTPVPNLPIPPPTLTEDFSDINLNELVNF